MRKKLTEKILVLGVDGLDPSLTKKFMNQGKLPNIKKFVDRGAQREDLVFLGAVPTITPPIWTTLSTGAYPNTHGITCFWNQSHENLDEIVYALSSKMSKAEPLWNIFAEAGKKTLVWHWPGSAWPPTSDSINLSVVDGTQPAAINNGVAGIDWDKIIIASSEFESVRFKPHASTDSGAGCILTDQDVDEVSEEEDYRTAMASGKNLKNIISEEEDCELHVLGAVAFDIVNSPIKDAQGWKDAPLNAKEFTILTSEGLVRRPALILQNENGEYDSIAIYKSKKEEEPLLVLKKDEFVSTWLDEVKKNDKDLLGVRHLRALEIAPDGSKVKLWMGRALDVNNNAVWHPKQLHEDIMKNVGFIPPCGIVGGGDPTLVEKALLPAWDVYCKWQADSLIHLMDNKGYDVIFSHLHNVDNIGHQIWHYAKGQKYWDTDPKVYQGFLEYTYKQTDDYIGRFLPYLDEGWTIFIVSDHGLITTEDHPPIIGEFPGVNIRVMQELGYTELKKDENGKEVKEIDWENTKAVATRGNHIWINLKGRNSTGIVNPEDKYKLEDEIISALYNYRDKQTGRRVISMAVRNKDAAILGLDGPESGDIIYFLEEGFNRIHGDGLPTHNGYFDTSVSPIFIAAGKGLKGNCTTERVIRQVDLAPTIAVLGGVRMPKQCEGAPIYQILAEEF
ncbi:MAG: alkaline phosphatase family protein [Bacillota bacterium]